MVQNRFWKAINQSSSASQNISFILWTSKFRYLVDTILQIVSLPSYIKPVHNLPSYSIQIHFSNVIPSKPRLPSGLFRHVSLLLPTRYTSRPFHCVLFDISNIYWCVVLITNLYIMKFFQSTLTSSSLCPNIVLSTYLSI